MATVLILFFLCMNSTILILACISRVLPSNYLAAKQSSRSNHTQHARQIGGLAIIPICLAAFSIIAAKLLPLQLALGLLSGGLLLWLTGMLDDRKELSITIRLVSQLIAASLVLYSLGPDFRLLQGWVPYWLEALALLVLLLACINITNFMDGLDWLTITGMGLPLLLLSFISALILPLNSAAVIAAIVSGSLAGFIWFNRPQATIFLGDSGSLPIGLFAGTAFLLFAQESGLICAVILPLYYIMDTSSTLLLRLYHRQNIFHAHTDHAYQTAKRAGLTTYKINGVIAALNISLGVIVLFIIQSTQISLQLIGLALATLITSGTIIRFRYAKTMG